MTAFSVLLMPEILCSPGNYLTSIRLEKEKEKEVEDEEEVYSEITRSDELLPLPGMQFFLSTELDMHLHRVR